MSKNLVTRADKANGITTITLNDPETRNAMSEEMAVEFRRTMDSLKGDAAVRVVILTGAGEAFSGGGHLEMLAAKTKLSLEKNQQLMELFYDQFLSITELKVPVVAAINGHAVGAGLCLSLACDMRIATTKAKLGLNFVHLGLHPGMGVTYFLPRLVGPARAAELLYLGKIISAEEGARLGVVNQVVSPEEFSKVVEGTAAQLSQVGPAAVRALKASLQASPQRSLAECLVREAECQALDYSGKEFLEGITAAKEKRKPQF